MSVFCPILISYSYLEIWHRSLKTYNNSRHIFRVLYVSVYRFNKKLSTFHFTLKYDADL